MSVRTLLTAVGLAASGAEAVNAAPVAVIPNPPTLLTLVIFAGAIICVVFSVRVLSLVRGGQLSRSWQLFLIGFFLLAVSQLAVLLHLFGVVVLPNWVVPTLLVLMAGLFLFGLFETRRSLG